MKLTRTDVIIICLSALFGFAAVARVSILAALIAGAPSGAMGGIVGCIILRLRRKLNLDLAFQSPEELEIYAHMTPDEKAKGSRLGGLYVLSMGIALFVPVMLAGTGHGYLSIIAAVVVVVAFVVWIPIWRKLFKRFLCSTAWAREQGLTPERIRKFPHRS
jgi:hypothetical protein